MLDIDRKSVYHPKHDPLAISRITESLEHVGLVNFVACTSSDSGGLHLYFPFEKSQHSWQLTNAVSLLLEHAGFKLEPGQLEIFPNPRLYVVDGTKSLFHAHRLPMQQGSYLLNSEFEPIFSSQSAFVAHWNFAQDRNDVSAASLNQVIREHGRKRYRVSQKAEKFLNDLNAEIEPGWTGHGQTNHLLGRIAMRCYIFNHVIHGGEALEGPALVQEIVKVATSLPGYQTWCQHQHEIEHRAAEWAGCISNSHYFHYGDQQGKYKAQQPSEQEGDQISWNQQQAIDTRNKIKTTVAQLRSEEKLPEGITLRFKALVAAGIGGASLYRYKDLWHPRYQPENLPQTPSLCRSDRLDCAEGTSNRISPTSLLFENGSNPSQDSLSSPSNEASQEGGGSNSSINGPQDILRLLQNIAQSPRELVVSLPELPPLEESRNREQHIAMVQAFLASADPILVAEAIDWLWLNPKAAIDSALFNPVEVKPRPIGSLQALSQDNLGSEDLRRQEPEARTLLGSQRLTSGLSLEESSCVELIPLQDSASRSPVLSCLLEIYEQLLRLRWPPEQILRHLSQRYRASSVANLNSQQRLDLLSWLMAQSNQQ